MIIRNSNAEDHERILEIYNQAVVEGFRTADTEPVSLTKRKNWFSLHNNDHYPIFVAQEGEKIIGWCSLSPYRTGRKALSSLAEISYYIDLDHRGQKVASRLIEHALDKAKTLGLKNFIAILLDINRESIKILEKYHFKKWGHLPEIADCNDTICGQYIYGRKV